MKRKIIEIDESLCNGCGQCVTGCAEGALEIIDGVAKIVADHFCDGLGACIGHCPTGALQIIERDAPEFDEHAVEERLADLKKAAKAPSPCGCMSSAPMSMTPCQTANAPTAQAPQAAGGSALSTWPIKLRLVPPNAPFLQKAKLLLAADCVPPAFPAFHSAFLPGRVALMGCPKFDDVPSYVEKLAEIIRQNDITDITVLQMEVPCCAGMSRIAAAAIAASGKAVPATQVVVTRRGEIAGMQTLPTANAPFAAMG
ncbi:MAG: ATP-binding protein [Acidobacteriota bacterium]